MDKLYTCKKSLNEYDPNFDKSLIQFITKFTTTDKEVAIEIVRKLNIQIAVEKHDEIEALRGKPNDVVKQQQSNELYMNMIVPAGYTIEGDELKIIKYEKDQDDEFVEVKEYISKAFTIKSIGTINDDGESKNINHVMLKFLNKAGIEEEVLINENEILDQKNPSEKLQPLSIVGFKRTECHKILS